MKRDHDLIYIGAGSILAVIWAILWRKIPPDSKTAYFFLLPVIVIPLLYLVFVKNKFSPSSWAKALLWLIVVFLGVLSFSRAILQHDLLKDILVYLEPLTK